MARQDSSDFLTAFAIGAALGVGAALLLGPEKPNPRKQLQKRLEPHARKLGKRAARTRRAARRIRRAAPLATEEAIHAGRELLAEFRGEVARILDEAREELRALAQEQGEGAPRPPRAAADPGE